MPRSISKVRARKGKVPKVNPANLMVPKVAPPKVERLDQVSRLRNSGAETGLKPWICNRNLQVGKLSFGTGPVLPVANPTCVNRFANLADRGGDPAKP